MPCKLSAVNALSQSKSRLIRLFQEVLLEHPAIRQVAVVGYPDARLSEVPVAFVELVASSSLTPDEVIALCKGRIAGFKVPRHVLLVKEFPMTSTGKIQKVVLREQALQQIPQTPRD